MEISVYGTQYDATEPCYLTTTDGVFVFDRVMNRWLEWASLAAKAAAMGHVWAAREVGIPSMEWQADNSRTNGKRWGPGLDETAGLASEQVTNGEDWTGATGVTPPTGWTALGNETFEATGGWLTVTATGGAGFGQNLPGLEAGKAYVVEVGVGGLTTGDLWLQIGGHNWPLGIGPEGGALNSVTKAASFVHDGAATGIEITMPPGSVLELKYLRVYLEFELTGSGGATTVITPPPPNPVVGPLDAAGVNVWLNTETGKVGLTSTTMRNRMRGSPRRQSARPICPTIRCRRSTRSGSPAIFPPCPARKREMASYDFSTALVSIGGTLDDTTLLDLLKQYLGITGADNDAELSQALNMAGYSVETYLDRVVLKREVEEYFPHHFGTVELHNLPVDPTADLTVDLNGDEQTDYSLWFDRNRLAHLSRTGQSFDVPMDWRPYANVTVTYTAGYDPLPSDLANAIIWTAALIYQSEGSGSIPGGGGGSGEIKSMSIYDVGSISYDVGGASSGSGDGTFPSAGIIPGSAAQVLSRYKRMAV